MTLRRYNTEWLLLGAMLLGVPLHAQTTPAAKPVTPAVPNPVPVPRGPRTARSAATVTASPAPELSNTSQATQPGDAIDRLIATVNGELVLESDIDEEKRMSILQPGRNGREMDREQAIERLIDRALILQQLQLQAEQTIPDADVQEQLMTLRKQLPQCAAAHCETDAGWAAFLKANELNPAEVMHWWKQRMEVLRYIEVRFRSGVQILPEDVKKYFDQNMLPEYQKRGVTPPPLDAVSERIEEVLLQQQVSALLQDWLKSLRSQGSVVMMKPGEMAP